MHNILILGSGRSGTSMVAGTLAKAHYYMGSRFVPPRDSNPKGFFEDHEINDINEAILKRVVPHRPRYIGRILFRKRLGYMQKWLARVPLHANIPSWPGIEQRIRRAVQSEPFCFKDPRFSYTLPVWRPFLRHTRFICVFRHPASTAHRSQKTLSATIEYRLRDSPRHLETNVFTHSTQTSISGGMAVYSFRSGVDAGRLRSTGRIHWRQG